MSTPTPESISDHDAIDDRHHAQDDASQPPVSSKSFPSASAAMASPMESETLIVRGIASYLSLSDVESIGSLYSMLSPPAYHQHTFTPRIRKIGSASPSVSNSYRFLQGQPHNRHNSAATLASIDDCVASDDDSELAGFDSKRSGIPMVSSRSRATFGEHLSNEGTRWGPVITDNLATEDDTVAGDMAETPGLIALSPIPLDEDEVEVDDDYDENSSAIIRISPSTIHSEYQYRIEIDNQRKHAKRKTITHMKMIQEKLKDAVFRHPHSIRSYCRTSHRSAIQMRQKLLQNRGATFCPHCHMISEAPDSRNTFNGQMQRKASMEYYLYHCDCAENDHSKISEIPFKSPQDHIIQFLASAIFDNIPLSILFDISHQSLDTSLKVTHASMSITIVSAETIINLLVNAVLSALDILGHNLNPLTLLSNIFRVQREAIGKTGGVIATGIHSAGTACMQVFAQKPDKNLHHTGGLGGIVSVGTRSPRSGMVSVGQSLVEGLLLRSTGNVREVLISEKMFRKLNKINPAGKVVKYVEGDDEVLTHHAKKRVQRMMHYSVPLRPFVATVSRDEYQGDYPLASGNTNLSIGGSDRHSISDDDPDSPFMCTPKSFPPTPSSRAHVLARGTRFAEDVVFLARDQLRVEEGLYSENEQTKAMAKALREGKRLAVFNASDVGGGIFLSCGQHRATKVGNDLYSSARGMIPMLRNSFVYFEMTISTPPLLSMVLHHASLSIGLSTLEMPLNALVGAWKGSVGICSTGQILAGGQWCSPVNPQTYGSNSTVGCLVYLDDDSAFETWDGVVCTANIVFNVDGQVIVPLSPETQEYADNDDEENVHSYSPVLPIFVPSAEELFPTLTLHSSQTEVLCRFCSEDILATSRKSVGAPSGVTVYAVDGSVIFDEDLSTSSVISNDDMSSSVGSSQSFDSVGICIDQA